MLKRMMLVAAVVGGISTTANAQIVTNGGFEAPVVVDPCCNTSPPAVIPGWTATPNVNVVNGTFSSTNGNLAFEGNQYLDLVGQGGTGSISQILTTDVGQLYTLSFAYSHNLFSGALVPPASAEVLVNGVLFGIVTHNSGTNANLDWQIFSQNFLATGPTTTLTFNNLTGGINEGIFLDAIGVAAVPEPATWAMMLLGFGAIGGAIRRQRKGEKLALAA
jgi:hypothetical protein